MKRCGKPFCTCDQCAEAIGEEHRAADKRCGREWVCQCGPCKRAREMKRTLPKRFAEGDPIEFMRSPGAAWELGTYVMSAHGFLGWHRVKDASGLRAESIIPNRRIRAAR